MILSLTVRGFKSLAEFSIELGKFNCFVGLNGAGKSSTLQALDLASHLMKGDIQAWLYRRGWNAHDLHSKFTSRTNIFFSINLRTESGKHLFWRAAFNRSSLNCTQEEVRDVDTGEPIFALSRSRYWMPEKEPTKVEFTYQGSIFSALKSEVLTKDLNDLREQIAGIRSLELLSPHLMRTTPRDPTSDIGVGGEKLSAFLYSVRGDAKVRLVANLKKFYPSIIDYKVKQERAGWKRLFLIEEFSGQRIETEAKHVNDGLLRILAILAQAGGSRSLLLFDEIENGVNPEIIERLVDILQQAPQQIVVTTHSPLILNYLTDEAAEKAVKFIYRSTTGGTKSRPLFRIPRMSEKLNYMGPGEAFVDTNLTNLTSECIQLDIAEHFEFEEDKGARD